MTEPSFEPAAFTRSGDRIEARLTFTLDDHVEAVWAALTEPQQLLQWLAPGEIEPRLGGQAKLSFQDSGVAIDSEVTAFEPHHRLEYSWSSPGEPLRPVRFDLEPLGPMTRLTLTLSLPAGENMPRSCAGWSAHLEMLAAALAGIPIKFPFQLFKSATAGYQAQLEAQLG